MLIFTGCQEWQNRSGVSNFRNAASASRSPTFAPRNPSPAPRLSRFLLYSPIVSMVIIAKKTIENRTANIVPQDMKTENTPNLVCKYTKFRVAFLKKNSYLCNVQQMINMKSIKTTVTLWLLCLFTVAPACMKTSEVYATVTRTQIIVNRVFTNDTTIKPTGLSGAIDKLTLYGQVDKLAPDFCVRMVLKATDGKEYLMMELYDALCDAPSRTFNDYAEETELLSSVTPDSIKIYVHNAQFSLTSLYKTVYTGNSYPNAIDPDTLRYRRAQAKVDTLNAVNVRQNKLWRAAVTDLSLKDHTTRKRVLGLGDGDSSYGMEYYGGGIFELGETPTNPIRENSPYVDNFDWRNRHGKNWITPVKHQGESGYCYAFATIGCLEAILRLYFNNYSDTITLSDQQVAVCCGISNPYAYNHGGSTYAAADYVSSNYIYDDTSYPFIDDSTVQCRSGLITNPIERVKAGGFKHITNSSNEIKRALMEYGPLIGCIKHDNKKGGHAMTLVGWGTIHAGDTIRVPGNFSEVICVPENDSRIGQTYWIYKDSYGTGEYPFHQELQGYYHLLFNDSTYRDEAFALRTPINRAGHSNAEIICEDADGDGYYNWGIGGKTLAYPWWAEQTDGDDSNPLLGPMDEYGHLENLNPDERDTLYINSNWNLSFRLDRWNHVVVCNGATWKIQSSVTFYNGAKLILRDNAKLIVNMDGVLKGANIISQSSGQIQVEDGGQIIRPTNGEFKVEAGSSFILTEGSIQ